MPALPPALSPVVRSIRESARGTNERTNGVGLWYFLAPAVALLFPFLHLRPPRGFYSYIDVDKMRVCRRTAALFFPDARLMRRPSPIDVALKVGWSSVFGVGLQQPTFIGSQQEKTDDQQTNAKKTDDQCKICYINWRGSIRWPSAIRLSVVRPFY